MKRKKTNLLVILLLFLFGIVQITYAQTIEGSFESRFKRYQKNQTFEGTISTVWHAVAWKGDRIHKQLIIWGDEQINDLSYEVSDLTKGANKISSDQVSLRFGKYVKGDAEARSCSAYDVHATDVEVADALSEIEINTLDPANPIKVWLTIDVPLSTDPGLYSGTVTVSGGLSDLVFSIELEVVDYTLPEVSEWDFHLDLWQFPTKVLDHYNQANPTNQIDLWSEGHYALLESAYRMLADMGQKAITTYIKTGSLGAPSMITWILKSDGTWVYDFSVFDQHVNVLMSWGITKQISCFSPVGWNENTIPYFDEASGMNKELDAPLGLESYSVRWDHFLSAFKAHLDSKGWFDKTVLYLDEVSESKLEAVTSVVHGNHMDWKLGIAYARGMSVESKEKFYDLSGILEDASNDGIDADKISTFYTSCTQIQPNSYVTPENSPAEMTWMGWHALSQNYDGYLRWAFDYWQSSDPFDMRDGAHTAGDFAIIYRNSNDSPMTYSSSIRMEMLREGIQDYEKVKILKERLESSKNPFDSQTLAALHAVINKFGKNSGSAAHSLVLEAQELIAQVSLNEYGYCPVNGSSQGLYYIEELTTTNGNKNIAYLADHSLAEDYNYHSSTSLNIEPGDSFNVKINNSTASNCARIKVWIDWNDNDSFEDDGEEVYSGGQLNSCDNDINHEFQATAPDQLKLGKVRMRARVGSSEVALESCGGLDQSSTIDFDVFLLDKYCQPSGDAFQDYYLKTLSTKTATNEENINYQGGGYPPEGYGYYTCSKVLVGRGETFSISFQNSEASKCAQTSLWIDWNADGDFEDEDEMVPGINNMLQSCENTTTKLVNVDVPVTADTGLTRMRIRLRDAWLDTPTACANQTFSSTFDFDILLKTSIVTEIENTRDTVLFPNPGGDFLTFTQLNGSVQVKIFTSTGQLLRTHNFEQLVCEEVKVNIEQLSPGSYLIQLSTNGNTPKTYRYIHL